MDISKVSQRDSKIVNRKNGMGINNQYSIQKQKKEQAKKLRKERKEKERLLEITEG
jgi:hypothetical protein